jgi:two-component system, OmpR family, copper resistance phosphate regulon response regulator CusR
VEVYINYLRRKVDKDFNKKLIHTRPGLGYVLRED